MADQPEMFDLVFTDFAMPGMSGLEPAEKIKSAFPEIPVLIGTGNPGIFAENPGLTPDMYVTKPFDPATLVPRLRSAMVRRVIG